MNTAPAESLRHDVKVIGLVGVAHGISHFFQLALPPLFPLLKAEFDVPFAALGVLMGVFYAASGLTQFAAGIVVDRIGARPVLLGGMALVAGGTLIAGMVPGLLWLYPLAALMGVGNGVFHPADFAILNTNVASRRLGYAYSMHGIGGNLGYAIAPVVSYALGAAFGWRTALADDGRDRHRRARRDGDAARRCSPPRGRMTRISRRSAAASRCSRRRRSRCASPIS